MPFGALVESLRSATIGTAELISGLVIFNFKDTLISAFELETYEPDASYAFSGTGVVLSVDGAHRIFDEASKLLKVYNLLFGNEHDKDNSDTEPPIDGQQLLGALVVVTEDI